ncbi:hypothetical protein JTB14_035128 [Gonioctena quinquepunctata]|nr:hypothetical protein JTB14_035128 [Gonioctena quinquepunctata]
MAVNLNIYYQNCRGLRSKTDEFYHNVSSSDFSVICLTETWLNSSVISAELFNTNYNIFRQDRSESGSPKSDGGGVIMTSKQGFHAALQVNLQSEAGDLWISLDAKNGEKLHICYIYLPPGDTIAYYSFLSKLRQNQHTFNINPVQILGDFNFPTVEWVPVSLELYFEPTNVTHKFSEIIDMCSFLELMQLNGILNTNGRILDLVFCNDIGFKSISHGMDTLVGVDSHHPPLYIDFKLMKFKYLRDKAHKQFNFNKANFEIINSELAVMNWSDCFAGKNVNKAVEILYEKLTNIITKNVPTFVIKKGYPSYFKPDTIQLLKEKN